MKNESEKASKKQQNFKFLKGTWDKNINWTKKKESQI